MRQDFRIFKFKFTYLCFYLQQLVGYLSGEKLSLMMIHPAQLYLFRDDLVLTNSLVDTFFGFTLTIFLHLTTC